MRILQLHSNFIVFKPVEKEINIAEEAEKVENRVEEVVVLFTAIEEGDNSAMAQKAINDVRAFLGKLKVNRILIYPFAHLSSNLSQPQPSTGNHQGHGSLRERERHRNLPCPIWLEQTIHDFYQGTSACRAGTKLCPSTSRSRRCRSNCSVRSQKRRRTRLRSPQSRRHHEILLAHPPNRRLPCAH